MKPANSNETRARPRFRTHIPLHERILRRALIPFFLGPLLRRLKPMETEHRLIRLGGAGDGGYLVPDDLVGVERCFSPGVGPVSKFEEALLARGIPCHLADGTVDAAHVVHPLMTFEKLNLGARSSPGIVSLEDWVNRHAAPDEHNLLLQMDIEGAEYEVLPSASRELLRRFRIIVMEFHWLDQLTYLKGGVLERRIPGCISKLLDDFVVVHIHPNNCGKIARVANYTVPRVMEITFLRRDRITSSRPARVFPHPLDERNDKNRPDIVLPECWFH
jgi:hypothetical protein